MNRLCRTHGRSSRHDRYLLNSVATSYQNRDVRRQALRTPRSLCRGRRVAHAPSRPEKASCLWTGNFAVTKRARRRQQGPAPAYNGALGAISRGAGSKLCRSTGAITTSQRPNWSASSTSCRHYSYAQCAVQPEPVYQSCDNAWGYETAQGQDIRQPILQVEEKANAAAAAPTHYHERASREAGAEKFPKRGSPVEVQPRDLGQGKERPTESPAMGSSRQATRTASVKEDPA